MNVITSKISMDLMALPRELPEINAVQGESNTRAVELSLFCGNDPWPIPEGTLLAVRYGRIGQGGGYYDTLPDGTCAYSYEGNTATILLAPQMMSIAGAVTAQVELIQGSQVLVTFPFKVMVAVNPAVGIVKSEDYVNHQQWLEQELDKYVNKVSQSGQILGGTVVGPVNMNGHILSGLEPPTATDHAVNKGYVDQQMKKVVVPRNLLDNSDFRNPVNQRGQTSYLGHSYSIDRWQVNSSTTLTVMDDFCRLSGHYNLWQIVPVTLKAGKTYTCAARIKASEGIRDGWLLVEASVDGTRLAGWSKKISDWTIAIVNFTPDSDLEAAVIQLTNSGDTSVATDIEWVALYEGEYTAETLPEYQPKGYGAELLECQQYLQRFRTADLRKTYCDDFRPTMRETAEGIVSTFDQEINGVTFYFASAEL